MDSLSGYDNFFYLLRCALLDEEPGNLALTPEEWRFIYETACRQSVQGVMFSVIERLPEGSGIPRELSGRWLLDTERLEADSRRQKAVMLKQKAVWEKYGIDAVLLKGLSVAQYYPQPQRRVSGDIDWWMRTDEDWNKALEVLAANDLLPETDSDGDIHYKLGGVVVEHHREGLLEDGPAGVLFLLNAHIMHHAMVFGVGLRQLCDYYMARRALEGQYDPQHYADLLASHGMTKWTAALDRSLERLSGEADGPDELLELVMSDGNMGQDKRHRISGFGKRARFFASVAPTKFAGRWLGLAIGRIKKN